MKLSKWFKVASTFCILTATAGFGYYTWNLNNKITDVQESLNIASRDYENIFRTFERFQISEVRSMLNRVHRDVIVGGQEATNKAEAISAAEDNMLNSLRSALESFASSVSDEYAKDIRSRAALMNWDQMQGMKVEIAKASQQTLDQAKEKKKSFEAKRLNLIGERDRWYIVFLLLQVSGIVFGVVAELSKKCHPSRSATASSESTKTAPPVCRETKARFFSKKLFGAVLSTMLLVLWLLVSFGYIRYQLVSHGWVFISWMLLMTLVIVVFATSMWLWIEERTAVDRPDIGDISAETSDAHIAKYNNVYSEITRYRDLSWKISLYAWGIYYGLAWYGFVERPSFSTFPFPVAVFFIMIFLAAIFATAFLLMCEIHANRNREQRRELEEKLKINSRWQFTRRGENPSRFASIVSIGVFLFAIWAPPLVMLFLK